MMRDLRPKRPSLPAEIMAAGQRFTEAWNELVRVIGEDRARQVVSAFIDPPKKKGRPRDAAYNAELVVTYALAPKGKKQAAAAKVARKYGKEQQPLVNVLRHKRDVEKCGLTQEELDTKPLGWFVYSLICLGQRAKLLGENVP